MKTTPELELSPFRFPSGWALLSPLLIGLLLAALWYLHRHGLPWDDAWARWFYRPENSTAQSGPWVWDEHQRRTSFWAHHMVRLGFQIFGLFAAWMAWRKPTARRGWLALLLALILVPTLISSMKHMSHHYCPDHLARFGGPIREDGSFDGFAMDAETQHPPKPQCFPAGHVAPGFALMALIFVARTRRGKIAAVALALGCGTALTFLQMARGEHFFSHGMASLIVALLLLVPCHWLAGGLLRAIGLRGRWRARATHRMMYEALALVG